MPLALLHLTFWVDPLQIFHDQPFETPMFISNFGKRWDIHGAIQRHFFRKQDKETVILGTSMAQNILHKEAEDLGGFRKVVNLSISGMHMGEAALVYDLLLPASALHTVVQSLDSSFFTVPKPDTVFWNPAFEFPEFLFGNTWEDFVKKLKTFYKIGVQKAALQIVFVNSLGGIAKLCSFDEQTVYRILEHPLVKGFLTRLGLSRRINAQRMAIKIQNQRIKLAHESAYWFSNGIPLFRLNCSPQKLLLRKERLQTTRPGLLEVSRFVATHTLAEINAQFNTVPRSFDYIFEKISHRPDIAFHFFIPPYCALSWAHKESFSSYIGGLLYLLDTIETCPNIHVYAFDDVPEITCNAANYMDDGHYGLGVNRYILKSMKAGKHCITKANVLAYLRRMAAVLLHVDPTPDFDHTVSFEGPLNEHVEKAFAAFPPPTGPTPLEP
jgi:hypothetical protein